MYILRISNEAFVKVTPNGTVITSDYKKIPKYHKIGEAMEMAAKVNQLLGSAICRVIAVY